MSAVRRGTYILVLTLAAPREVTVGALGSIRFPAGTYCYVGSAAGGLDQRVGRHLRHNKKLKWHIDYLTVIADRVEAYESYPDPVPECELARLAERSGGVPAVAGFGCSDCHCRSHLFWVDAEALAKLIPAAGLHPFTGTVRLSVPGDFRMQCPALRPPNCLGLGRIGPAGKV
ncbi:MAG: GIY-YIG nuclease family protein [Candidatus Methanomethylophilus sp.]|nr:GIY-YIG nuclease family protein [Methanomethylophilus sp.]MDD4221747.1 GIY-YIG nuclease family protein [Methanomethylophilus sp.]MDD4668811.1 GIY-YIG nuclease family protein [Methanomethylophilus sp.]